MAKLNLRGALATTLLLIAEAAGAQADAGHLGHHPPPAAAAAPMPATPSAAQVITPETPVPMPTAPARPAPMAMPAPVAPGMAAPAPAAAPGTAPAAPIAAPAMPAAAPGMAGGGMMMDMMGKMMAPASPGAAAMPAAAGTATAPGMAGMPAPAAAGGCMGTGCGAGGAGTSPIYASLMTLPALTPEKRAEIEALGNQQLGDGMGRLASSYEALNHAAQASDHAAMQQAAGLMREALGQVGSGIAARRVLTEGKSPRNLALDWFKREMSLASPIAAVAAGPAGGVRLFHFITMLLLIAFAVAMVTIYVLRMRRAAALFGRLEGGSGGPPPPANGKPPPTAPSGAQSAPADAPAAAGAAPKAEPAAAAADTAADAPPVSAKWQGRLRVGSVIVETPSVKTLRLLPSSGTGLLPFIFLPGQFLNLSLWIGGAKMNRSYSISSSPMQRGFVDLTVKREPRGAVSRHVDDLLKVGDLIDVSGPVGKFTFTGAEASSIVLIAGGVGITPMMSIARTLTEQAWPGDIYFLYACRAPPDFIFAKDIAALQQGNPKLHVTVTMEKPEGSDWAGATGRITAKLLTETVPALTTRRVHLCGPPVMMDAIKALLSELGVPPEQVKTEDFGTAAPQPAAAGSAAKSAAPATGPLVRFSKSDKASKSRPDQTVLELSEELGIGIEFSCRVGTCGVCKVTMTAGEVEMAVEDALDAEDKAKGIILACQAKPKADLVVEA